LRYYVHVDIVEKFLELLKNYAHGLVIGDPLDDKTKMGPVVSKEHYQKVMSYINLAVNNGHTIVCGETVE
jgi:aminomuconate-semialdehyde/2-hydroxymuconate-6-semialdehyde dehydrogenase